MIKTLYNMNNMKNHRRFRLYPGFGVALEAPGAPLLVGLVMLIVG
jgi:hypothetical protein